MNHRESERFILPFLMQSVQLAEMYVALLEHSAPRSDWRGQLVHNLCGSADRTRRGEAKADRSGSRVKSRVQEVQ